MPDDRRRDDSRPADPAEGVRIIGADEAAEAIERGDVAARRGGDLPRYGDRPARPPVGPKPALRFPLEAGADPSDAAVRPAKGTRFDPRPPPAWDDPAPADDDDGDPWPADSTWGDAASWDDSPNDDVVAWSQGDTAAQPAVDAAEEPEEGSDEGTDDGELSWAEEFVDEDDPWDGSWDEPTGAVRWADDEAEPAADAGGTAVEEGADAPTPEAATAAPGPEAADDDAADDWAAFAQGDVEPPPEPPKRARGLFSRRRLVEEEPAEGASGPEPSGAAAPVDEPAPALFDDTPGEPDEAAADDTVVADVPAPPAEEPPLDEGEESTLDEPAPEAVSGAATEGPTADEVAEADVAAADEASPPDAGGPWPDEDDLAWDAPEEEEPRPGVLDESGGWAEPAGSTVFDFADEPSGQVALPHWTEPATGELPKVLAGDDTAAAPAPPAAHWRSHDAGWDVDDFDDLTDDEEVRGGALDDSRPSEEDLYSFDELDEVGRPADPVEPVGAAPERRVPPARPHPGVAPGGGGGAGRNIGVATAVGVGVAVVAVALLAMGAKFAMILVVLILGAAVGEYQNATRRAGYRPSALLGIVATVCYPLAVYWKGLEAYPLLLVLTLGTALAWHLVGADGDARVVESAGVTLMGVLWVGGLGSFAALLLSLPDGRGMLVAAILAAVGYDVGGLLIGRTMGTRPLSDASPNKTIEGLVGGMFISLFVVFVVCGLFGIAPFDSPGAALKIGFVAALAAPLGDLCESLVKRDLGIKDMSSLLPEHGGVLDRFDGLLFVLPAVFYGAMLFELGPF